MGSAMQQWGAMGPSATAMEVRQPNDWKNGDKRSLPDDVEPVMMADLTLRNRQQRLLMRELLEETEDVMREVVLEEQAMRPLSLPLPVNRTRKKSTAYRHMDRHLSLLLLDVSNSADTLVCVVLSACEIQLSSAQGYAGAGALRVGGACNSSQGGWSRDIVGLGDRVQQADSRA